MIAELYEKHNNHGEHVTPLTRYNNRDTSSPVLGIKLIIPIGKETRKPYLYCEMDKPIGWVTRLLVNAEEEQKYCETMGENYKAPVHRGLMAGKAFEWFAKHVTLYNDLSFTFNNGLIEICMLDGKIA